MSENKDDTQSIRISQVLAGALAAVTAALIGSTMGVAGTVVGAGLASVISTVGGAVYLRSIQRTRESVRTVRAKVVGRSGGSTVLVSDEKPAPGEVVEADTGAADATEAGEAAETEVAETGERSEDRPPVERRRLRWPVLAGTTLAAFALGMGVITGVEALRGESLSGGSGTTFGNVIEPHHNTGGEVDEEPTDRTPTTNQTTSTTTPTSTDATKPTEQPTTTTPRSSDSTTSSTPPVTTTTESVPPSVSNAPSR
jgi:hypothetical protein